MVIDNGSQDDSVGKFRSAFPDSLVFRGLPGEEKCGPEHSESDVAIHLYDVGRKAGYVAAYNAAFATILANISEMDVTSEHGAVAILNADLELAPGCLDAMLRCMWSHSDTAAVQAKLRSLLDRESFDYSGAAGGCIDRWGFTYTRGRLFYTIEQDMGQYDHASDIFWSCGVCSLIRLQALRECGVLDEQFEMHMEEVDLCWRFHLGGWRVLCEPKVVAYHQVSASSPADSFFRLYFNHRNAVMMVAKNTDTGSLLVSLGGRFVLDIMAWIRSLLTAEWLRAYAISKAYAWIGLHIVHICSARKDVQKNPRVEEGAVLKKMRSTPIALEYFVLGKRTYRDLHGEGLGVTVLEASPDDA